MTEPTYAAAVLDEALASGNPDLIEACLSLYAGWATGAAHTAEHLEAERQAEAARAAIYVSKDGAMVFGDTAEDQDAFFAGR